MKLKSFLLLYVCILCSMVLGGGKPCPIPEPLDPNAYWLDPNLVNYPLQCVINAVEGTMITRTLTACDPDGDPLAYNLLQAPAGMNIVPGDPNEVVLGWLAVAGIWYVDIEVYDMPPDPNDSLNDRGTIVFNIRKENHPPVFGGCR